MSYSILDRLMEFRERMRAKSWRNHFLKNKASHRHLEIGENVTFNVPVRGDGQGVVIIGKNTLLGYGLAPRIGTGEILIQARTPQAEIRIGDSNAFSNNITLIANERITIGNNCRIGDLVSIVDSDFHEINPATRGRSCGLKAPVVIGNNVWLGSRVMILKGVSIGDNTVVGAMSLVTKSMPANCIVAGNPARVIRNLDQTT